MIKLMDSTVQHGIMAHCHLTVGSYYLSGQKVKNKHFKPIRNCQQGGQFTTQIALLENFII